MSAPDLAGASLDGGASVGPRPRTSPWSGGWLHEAVLLLRRQGPGGLLRLGIEWLTLPLWRRHSSGHFVYRGEAIPYAIERYRLTWTNERAVELPLARRELARVGQGTVLEVGNVLRHYLATPHRVIDKYERAPGVENLDVLAIARHSGYDLVIAISTLEHVGWDETPCEPGKTAAAVAHLKTCLKPGGRLWFTVPLGYHPTLDAQLAAGTLGLTRIDCLERTGELSWREIPWGSRTSFAYGDPYRCANGVAIGLYEAPATAPAPP